MHLHGYFLAATSPLIIYIYTHTAWNTESYLQLQYIGRSSLKQLETNREKKEREMMRNHRNHNVVLPICVDRVPLTDDPTSTLLGLMRASSPTASTTQISLGDSYDNLWRIRHPSALGMFGEIMEACKGKQIVMFLDYDGTLSPIVADPDKAFLTTQMRETVRDVARHFPTAIVTGRCISKVYEFVKLSELYYAGSHGMDIKGPEEGHTTYTKGSNSLLCQPAKEFLPMIDEVHKALLEKTKSIEGAKVEDNKFCLSVHYRCVEENKWIEVAEHVKSVLKGFPRLRLSQGRMVLEIRPSIKWDKGNALEFLLESLGYGNSDDVFPVYIGDDRTDEDAFKVLQQRRQGLGIIVSKTPKETNASFSLEEPLEVMQFLRLLVDEISESNFSYEN